MRYPLPIGTILLTTASAVAQPVIHVNADAAPGGDGLTWATAFVDLQDALGLARTATGFDEVWLAEGTYTPALAARDCTFTLVDGLALYGGFAGDETERDQRDPAVRDSVLSGDLRGNDGPGFVCYGDNSRRVITAEGVGPATVIDGLVVRGGNADFPSDDLTGGGGLFVRNSSPTIAGCRFESNSAGLHAGPTIGGFGGAVCVRGGSPVFERCEFSENRGDNGGAVGLINLDDPVECEFTGCTFTGNTVSFQPGGALYSLSDRVRIDRCAFVGNRAGSGGAIADFNTDSFEIIDTLFEDNVAHAASAGAVMQQQTIGPDTEPMRVRRCVFICNQADRGGGAMTSMASDFDVADTFFLNNHTATSEGGAIKMTRFVFTDAAKLDAVNCVFAGNSAERGGAIGMILSHEGADITNSTFFANQATAAGGGIVFSPRGPGPLAIANSVFWRNTAAGARGEAAQISTDRPFLTSVDHSIVEGFAGGLPGTGSFDADPVFVDALGPDGLVGTRDDDLRPDGGSPAIDASDNGRVPAGVTTDIAGEDRFKDDPEAPDTGVGSPPIVDMGAHERQAACRPDLDGDGLLTIFDFLLFQNLFDDGDQAADFDGDGELTLFDFLEFQNLFTAGCE